MTMMEQRDKRQRVLKLEGVVLRHSDWGEADRLIWLFTLELGKIRAVAKGVRKIRSRKAGHLEPFTRTSLLLAKGRDILLITQADTLDGFLTLREDLAGTTYASYIVELLDRFTYEEGENRALYRLLVESLRRLADEQDRDLVARYYELRLLDLVGFRPELFRCLGCGEEIQPQDQYFSAAEGGALCPRCGSGASGAQPISKDALKYMRHFQRSSFADAKKARMTTEVQRELENILQYYLTYLLEQRLNTPAFLRRLRQPERLIDLPDGLDQA
ncbi:MAG: DNA repair protein RecO [Anaerolineae bacterium UTCFX2]|jgi:DNA repair protein RecO (recombination protein O)|nr:MAG: DNA repair protein RecO [Anaerolineae bacterium UTCFX2]